MRSDSESGDSPADGRVNGPAASRNGPGVGQTTGGGRFRLQRILGQGGMGVVWLADDRLLRELVALKFLPQQIALDPAALKSLRHEALRARKLSHPNIVRIHDLIDPPDEPPFICMEFVDGPTLHLLRTSDGMQLLKWDFLEPLVRQLCGALDYAHGENVIHRDIKPANLILDKQGRLKLTDFGLARVVSESFSRLSEQSHTSGTVGYMSPQQADGGRPHVTDDIYAVGATLYELLTGTPPFHSGDVGYQLRHTAPEPMQQRLAGTKLSNEIPSVASDLVMACLAKEPERRPQSAREILAVIDGQHTTAVGSPRQRGVPPRPAQPEAPLGFRWNWRKAWLPVLFLAVIAGAVLSIWPGGGRVGEDPNAGKETAAALKVAERSAGELPHPSAPADGFEILFNGRDLTGWDGDTNYWHVRDGAITAFTSEEGVSRRENTCLIWREPVDDFELRLKFRLKDVITAKPANSGVLYRSRRLEDWRVQGYQCDLHGDFTGTLLLLWDTLNDPRVGLGESARLREVKGRVTVRPTGTAAEANEIKGAIQKEDWNELVVIARGNHLSHEINGLVTADVIDETGPAQVLSGCLAFELKRATTVQFKDVRLKRLPPRSSERR